MPETRWTTIAMPSQAGRLAIVTGATSGIGYEAALALAGAGAEVVLAARNAAKAERALASIRHRHPNARLAVDLLDTARLASVQAFGDRWRAEGRPVDILLLNAGIASVPRREETEDGFERQLGTNYLGHFALTGLLLPFVARRPTSRIVPVASLAHRPGRIHFDDLQLRQSYGPQKAYRQSKLAMLMFGLELDRRLRAAGVPIRSIPVHPGAARTDVFRRGDRAGPIQRLAGHAIFSVIGQSAADGALPLLFAATAPEAEGGAYYGPDGIWELRGHPTRADIAPQAQDKAAAERLWSLSETLTGTACTV
ncbi:MULTISPECIES: oxidoreductase [unclassified Methylobacterium]|jgi:NAD(P)-dependent dehydrogenase (short-subunit alcohol dehydrogenase family)|uniref:oxidoreductase n=1 Tax=unclassified Methylobacterium TaxID=2615210 RepID=UPI0013548F0B|nr:oxidoreductase [Methylobacterium sp. 2A]MWV20578.1 SDR family NAD(P)-dependent oxidoreductase [Methylobacterium sp. 2A]